LHNKYMQHLKEAKPRLIVTYGLNTVRLPKSGIRYGIDAP
jgi:hypothetical protein